MKRFYWTITFVLLAALPSTLVSIEEGFASSDLVQWILKLNQRDYTGVIINSGRTQGEMRFSISGKTLKSQVKAIGLRPGIVYALVFYPNCQGVGGLVLIGFGSAGKKGSVSMKSTVVLSDEVFGGTTPSGLAEKLAPWIVPLQDITDVVDQRDLILGGRYHLRDWRLTESLFGTPSKPCLRPCQGAESDLGVEIFLAGMLDFYKSFWNTCDQQCQELCQNEDSWCRENCSVAVKKNQLLHILCTASCTLECNQFHPSSCSICQPQCDGLYGSFDIDGCNAACDSKYAACVGR